MNSLKTAGSFFQFEPKDTCVKEVRPLIDPLPLLAGMNSNSFRISSPIIRCSSESNWNNLETPTESNFSFMKPQKGKEKPAGSPSFARRPIPNGHFQRGDEFKPSIRIHHPPGGIDRIGL